MVGQVGKLHTESLRRAIEKRFIFRNRVVYVSLVGFFVGITISTSVISVGFSGALALCFLAGVLFLYDRVFGSERRGYAVFLSVLLVFCALGIFRVAFDGRLAEKNFDSFVGSRVVLSGVVAREVDIREDSRKITLLADTISDNQGTANYTGKVLVSGTLYPTVAYGDRIRTKGVLSYPRTFSGAGETGRTFDYGAYLAKDGIFYTMDRAEVSVLSHGEGNWVQEKLYALKHQFVDTIGQILSEPYASLLSGLLLGGKQSLGKELLDQFKIVGLIHIVVLSGYNITLVGDAILRLFSFLPRVFALSASVVSIVLFAIMTGAGATVVRASVMALIALYARTHGRIYAMSRALLFAGFLMVLHNPHILLFDTSFQLSFLATLGLILLSPIFKEKLSFVTERFLFREIVASTLATQIFVLPLLLYNTGALSLLALPANLLVLPTIPATMLSGFVATVVAFVSPIFALLFIAVASLLLHYQVGLVRLVSSIPFASVSVPAFPIFVLIVMYVALGIWIFWMSKNTRKISDVDL